MTDEYQSRSILHLENCTLEKTSNIQFNEPSKRKNQTEFRNAMRKGRSSKEERRADALALRADERRDKLRKAAGRSKYPEIRGCLNGETRRSKPPSPYSESIGIRREPGELKHLSSRRRRKKTRFSE